MLPALSPVFHSSLESRSNPDGEFTDATEVFFNSRHALTIYSDFLVDGELGKAICEDDVVKLIDATSDTAKLEWARDILFDRIGGIQVTDPILLAWARSVTEKFDAFVAREVERLVDRGQLEPERWDGMA